MEACTRRLVIPIVVLMAVGCGSTETAEPGPTTNDLTAETSPTTASPATTSTVEVTVTGSITGSTTIPSSAESTTTALPPGPPLLLVTDDHGARVLADGRAVEVFVEGEPISVALPDLTGGVVFQRAAEGSPIERIPRSGDESEVLVSGKVWVEDVAHIDERPQVVYRTLIEDPSSGCAEDDDECRWWATTHHLNMYDLETGIETDLGIVAHFESSWINFDLAQERMVVLTATYGEPDACGAVWDRSRLTDIAGSDAMIGETGPFFRRCDFGPGADGVTGSLRAGIATDESTIAYVETVIGEAGSATTFVVIDPVTLRELRRLTLEPPFDPAWIDWDGSYAVVGDWEGTVQLLIGPDDTVTDLATLASDESRFILWRESGELR